MTQMCLNNAAAAPDLNDFQDLCTSKVCCKHLEVSGYIPPLDPDDPLGGDYFEDGTYSFNVDESIWMNYRNPVYSRQGASTEYQLFWHSEERRWIGGVRVYDEVSGLPTGFAHAVRSGQTTTECAEDMHGFDGAGGWEAADLVNGAVQFVSSQITVRCVGDDASATSPPSPPSTSPTPPPTDNRHCSDFQNILHDS